MTALAPPRMPAAAPRDAPPAPAAPRSAHEPTLPVALARGIALLALTGFGALHWMALPDPGEPRRALAAIGVAAVTACALLAAARLPGRWRQLGAVVVIPGALALALLAAGVPSELLRPARWPELVGGIWRGVVALPGVRVPYRGTDEWIRVVMPLGGTALAALAALLAFWPRRERLGRPIAALIALVTLYAVPAVTLIFTVESLRGAVLALLVLAFLLLEKLRRRDAGAASAIAASVVLGGLLVGPALDADRPWWDYESWALEASSAKTTSFSWDHRYGPLNWPRDGRELARVRARRPAYWKVENLDVFDGDFWRHGTIGVDAFASGLPDTDVTSVRQWIQDIRVSVRNLRSGGFITAGFTPRIDAEGIANRPIGDGTFEALRRLHRGDAYGATVYAPQPSERLRRIAPATDDAPLWPFLELILPARNGSGYTREQAYPVAFPRRGEGGVPRAAVDGSVRGSAALAREALERGPYAGVWELAQRLQQGAGTQEDVVQNVMEYLRRDFTYTELPPRAAQTLPGFLLRAKTGYCQQFSGAMALLLRMAGIPARVSTGFTSGALDARTHEYVVRDLDAHSWVEVWYSGYGWVTFDPTPASAPPRAQEGETSPGGPNAGASSSAPNLPGDRPSLRQRVTATPDEAPWWRVPLAVAGGLGLLLVGGWAVWRRRRPRTPPLAELERALRRARRQPPPGATLRVLEANLAGSPDAARYVRAVREARYGGRPAEPSPSERRALRAELRRGGGIAGLLRAWWALPPRLH